MKYVKFLFKSVAIITSISLIVVPSVAFADAFSGSTSEVCSGVGEVSSSDSTATTSPAVTSSNGCDPNSASELHKVIVFALDLLSIIVGLVAVIMVIVGGFKFVTSGGDSAQVSGARNTILFAVVGIVVVVLAQVIVRFVLENVGSKVGN
jgi:hypothetical protein